MEIITQNVDVWILKPLTDENYNFSLSLNVAKLHLQFTRLTTKNFTASIPKTLKEKEKSILWPVSIKFPPSQASLNKPKSSLSKS